MNKPFVNNQKPCGITSGHSRHKHRPVFGGPEFQCHGALDANSFRREWATSGLPLPWRYVGLVEDNHGSAFYVAPVGTPLPDGLKEFK